MYSTETLALQEGYEKAWGREHTSTLDTVNYLGNFYADQVKMAEVTHENLHILYRYQPRLLYSIPYHQPHLRLPHSPPTQGRNCRQWTPRVVRSRRADVRTARRTGSMSLVLQGQGQRRPHPRKETSRERPTWQQRDLDQAKPKGMSSVRSKLRWSRATGYWHSL